MERKYFKTVVVSDLHLGSLYSKVVELTRFLESLTCDTLILAGDIIDGWQLKKIEDKWTVRESAFIKSVMELMEVFHTEVIYVTGNHDDFLDHITPCQLFNINIVNEYMIDDEGGRFVVIHGHAFDSITSHFKWLSNFGDTAYNFLLRFNNLKNRARDKQGKEKYSFSKALKHGGKKAVNLISGFESDIAEFAKSKKCDGIICGHIHHPEDKILKHGIRYLNSGDWVESLTALGEDEDCKWKVLKYGDLVTEGVSTD